MEIANPVKCATIDIIEIINKVKAGINLSFGLFLQLNT